NFGKIVKSTNGGTSWITQQTSTHASLQDVAAWSETNAVAVGDKATIIVTHDGGSHWSAATSVPHTKSFNKLISVFTLPGGQAWAVGQSGAILRSKDHGANWQRMHKTQRILFHDVYGSNQGIWVVGEFGTILYTD